MTLKKPSNDITKSTQKNYGRNHGRHYRRQHVLSLVVETTSRLICHHVYAMSVVNCLYHRKNAPDSVVLNAVVAITVENNMQKQRLHDRRNYGIHHSKDIVGTT